MAQNDVICYDDLRERPLIIEGSHFNIHRLFVDRCLACGFEPTIAVETTEISLCLRLATMGEGIAIVPDFIARQAAGKHVSMLPFADKELVWEYGLVWRKGSRPQGLYASLCSWLPEHL